MTVQPKANPADKPGEKDEATLEAEANAAAAAEATPAPGETTPAPGKGEEITPPAAPAPAKPKTPDGASETPPAPLEEEDEELSSEDLAHLSQKAQKRFQALSKKAKQAKDVLAENTLLKKQLGVGGKGRQTPPPFIPTPAPTPAAPAVTPPPVKLPWETTTPGETVLTQEQFDQTVDGKATEKAGKLVKERVELMERLGTLRQDIWYTEQEFPELYAGETDPVTGEVTKANPDFDANLAGSIVSWYRKLSAADPKLRFLVFAREVMGLRAASAEKAKSQISQTVAKQAAEQALTPTGSPAAPTGDSALIGMINSAKTEAELEEAESHLPHSDR